MLMSRAARPRPPSQPVAAARRFSSSMWCEEALACEECAATGRLFNEQGASLASQASSLIGPSLLHFTLRQMNWQQIR